MDYCTGTHVQEEFKSLDLSTAGSSITSAQVGRFIEEESAVIDARLALRFVTPITGTSALIIMRKVAIGLVAQRVKRIMEVQGIEEPKEQAVRTGDLIRESNALLADLVAGRALLSDATLLSTQQGLRDYNSDNCVEHSMKLGVRQW